MAEGKEYYIRVRGALVTVTPDVYRICHKTKRQAKTLYEKDSRHDLVSYNALDTEETLGVETIADSEAVSVEDAAIHPYLEPRYFVERKFNHGMKRLSGKFKQIWRISMDAVITAACPWKSAMNGRFSIKSRNLWAARARCQIWLTSTNTAKVFFWSAARKRDEMLELYDGKLSRTVLRRESGSNPADLAGTIFGGFAPNSKTADELSRSLGSYTVQSGSVSRSKGENSQSLQMAERALMTPDELKSIPKGEFVVMKTGSHPMRTRLRLFLDWGITFGEPYQTPEHGQRKVYYAGRQELEDAIIAQFWTAPEPEETDRPPQRERSGQRLSKYIQQEAHAGQPLATFPKKQDALPADADGR